jgi:hypothetical protein
MTVYLLHFNAPADEGNPPMTDATPPSYRPSRELLDAVPGLARIADELNIVLRPAMLAGHPDSRGMAEAGWMLAKALRFLAVAARVADDRDSMDQALSEVDTDALAVAGRIRSVRGIAASPEKLAAAGESARQADFDLGDPIAAGVTVRVLWPDTGQGPVSDEVTADLDALGRMRWTSTRYGQLPVDGRTQLDLGAALDGIAAAYARTALGVTS